MTEVKTGRLNNEPAGRCGVSVLNGSV